VHSRLAEAVDILVLEDTDKCLPRDNSPTMNSMYWARSRLDNILDNNRYKAMYRVVVDMVAVVLVVEEMDVAGCDCLKAKDDDRLYPVMEGLQSLRWG
jgi:hypothetical protein